VIAPRAPISATPRSNLEHLAAALDSPLAFHGMRPHVTLQLAEHLARQGVVALAAVPPALRTAILEHLSR
jgi:hypothetical protein